MKKIPQPESAEENSAASSPAPAEATDASSEKENKSAQLRENIPVEMLSRRPGPGGSQLTYMEAQDVFESANQIFGFDGWGSRIVSIEVDYCDEQNGLWNVLVTARCHVWTIDAANAGHEDVGHHSSKGKDRGDTVGNCKKAAVTDAKKRALRLLGPRLGGMVYNRDKVRSVQRSAARMSLVGGENVALPAPPRAPTPPSLLGNLNRNDTPPPPPHFSHQRPQHQRPQQQQQQRQSSPQQDTFVEAQFDPAVKKQRVATAPPYHYHDQRPAMHPQQHGYAPPPPPPLPPPPPQPNQQVPLQQHPAAQMGYAGGENAGGGHQPMQYPPQNASYPAGPVTYQPGNLGNYHPPQDRKPPSNNKRPMPPGNYY